MGKKKQSDSDVIFENPDIVWVQVWWKGKCYEAGKTPPLSLGGTPLGETYVVRFGKQRWCSTLKDCTRWLIDKKLEAGLAGRLMFAVSASEATVRRGFLKAMRYLHQLLDTLDAVGSYNPNEIKDFLGNSQV